MNRYEGRPEVSLQCRALVAEASTAQRIWLRQIWQELSAGSTRIVASFFGDERSYLILTPRVAPEAPPGRDRFSILEDVLCANSQKVVAFERAMAPSTVASNAKASLLSLGLQCNPSRVPPLVQQAARAWRYPQFDQQVPFSLWEQGDVTYAVVSAPRAEQRLRSMLSDAEFKVVGALIEGFSHTEIARERGTSRRTIANQLATAFRRIGVSSRCELLHRLTESV